jgi:hypothetical protein
MATSIPANQTPKFVPPIPTPSYGGGGSATVVLSSAIAASPATCVEVVLDPTTYPAWNRWIPRVVVDSAPPVASSDMPPALVHLASRQGNLLPRTQFSFEVHMNPDSESFNKTDLEVSLLEEFERDGRKGLRVAWKTQGDPWYLRAERVQEFLQSESGGGCDYTSYETFHGPLTWVVKTFVGKALERGLALWMKGLKAEAEARSDASTTT